MPVAEVASATAGCSWLGRAGFLPALARRVLEAGLQAELIDDLGYEKHAPGSLNVGD